MPLRNKKHWIFDMDGTLTEPVHDFEAIRIDLGIPTATPILEYIKSLPADEALAANQKLDEMEMEIAHHAVAQPFASELLSHLQDRNVNLGILTRNSEQIAEVTLKACGLWRFFNQQCVIGRETCLPKPEPDGVNHLLGLWSADPVDAVIVGDYLFDIEAGKRAGISTIHYDHAGQFPWPEFTDFRVNTISEIGVLIG